MVRLSRLLLLFMAWSASARADTPHNEELAPPAPATSPFEAFRRPDNGVEDPDRLLTPELMRKSSTYATEGISNFTIFVVYDQSRHPVGARALAEHLNTDWKIDGKFWLVVVSTHPADAWILPTRHFGLNGGHRAGIPVAVERWKHAAEELAYKPEGPDCQAAWDSALDAMSILASLVELNIPGEKRLQIPLSDFLLERLEPIALAIGLLLVGGRLSRLRPESGPNSLLGFLVADLGWILLFGLSVAWVRTSFPFGALIMAMVGTPSVFAGSRGLAGYFGFERDGYRSSACALAAIGMLWTMMAFSSRVLEVGVMTRSSDVRQLPATPGGSFLLQGAWVKEEFTAINERSRITKSGNEVSEIRRLAPLVFEGWTPGQPVPAWLICQYIPEHSEEPCNWGERVQNAIAPSGLGTLEQEELVEVAEHTTALRSVPGAKLVSWSEDAPREVRNAAMRGLLLPLVLAAAFVAVAVYGRRWDVLSRNRR